MLGFSFAPESERTAGRLRKALLCMESSGLGRDTARAMSDENVEAFRRGMEAYNRRDIDAFLDAFDPAVEFHPLTLAMFGQEATVYRGHEGIRQFIRDVDEVLPQVQVELLEIRDLGERSVASGRLHARG